MIKENPIGLKPNELQRGNINGLKREYVRDGRRVKMCLNIGGDLNEARWQQRLREKTVPLIWVL